VTLAGRLTLWFAAVAVTVSGIIGGLSYAATDRTLDDQTRAVLLDAATTLAAGDVPDGLAAPVIQPDGDADSDDPSATASAAPGPSDDGHGGGRDRGDDRVSMLLAQRLAADGTTSGISGLPATLPVDTGDRAVAAAATDHDLRFRNVTVNGAPYLLLTRSRGHGEGAVQVARSMADHLALLGKLAGSIVVFALFVAVAAAVAGRFLARALTGRLVRLTAAAEQVTATGRLDVDLPVHGRDEVGRLGAAFDDMLVRLARARDDQQRLVQNAGHELRTPLTSIRTNVSLLRRASELPAGERAAILDDLTGETRELTDLVNELVELATDRRAGEPEADVDLVALTERVAERARRRSGRTVTVVVPSDGSAHGSPDDGRGVVVRGRAHGLERAVTNLVDNAIKFDVAGGPVEIVVLAGRTTTGVEVRDRGPGVPPEDVERIFDRFHRATAVRSLPGSGLGLSIVRDVVADHGGRVFATARDGGGAVIGFTLPGPRLQPGSYPG